MGSLSVPVIDISPLISKSSTEGEKQVVVNEVGNACKDWGFFYVQNHGVDLELVKQTTDLGLKFFKMPKEFKQKVARREDNMQGWSDSELTKQKLDWKEVFDFTPDTPQLDEVIKTSFKIHGVNQWPDISQFKETMDQYVKAMQSLGRTLLSAILHTLKQANIDEFMETKCFPGQQETSLARLNYYPKCPNPNQHLGVGPHSDSGILTILLQDCSVASLQVERDGVFYDIPPIDGTFVINIGDMMQVWSNAKYKGPVHRVLANHDKDRFSLPYFLAPAYSCDIQPLEGTFAKDEEKRYRTINWGYFRAGRYEGDYADKGEEIQITRFEIKRDR